MGIRGCDSCGHVFQHWVTTRLCPKCFATHEKILENIDIDRIRHRVAVVRRVIWFVIGFVFCYLVHRCAGI